MLTSDLVRVRRQGKELTVVGLRDKARERAVELAERYDALVQAHQGLSYGELREALAAVEVGPRDRKLALGLIKLLEDQLELDAQTPVEPRLLRGAVFAHAAALRRENPRTFERARALELAKEGLSLGELSLPDLEEALYADLKSEKRVASKYRLSAARGAREGVGALCQCHGVPWPVSRAEVSALVVLDSAAGRRLPAGHRWAVQLVRVGDQVRLAVGAPVSGPARL
jgi:hypothetical protein